MPSAVGPAPVPGYEALLWPCPRCGSRDVEAVNRPARSHRWLGFLAFGLLWKLVERKAAKGTVQMATRCRACQKEWSTVVDKPT